MTSVQEKPRQGPWIDIDLGALCANFAMFRETCPGAEVAAVVKCNGYGLGAAPIATALREREACNSYFVVYAEEGAALRAVHKDSAPEIYCFAGPSTETLPLFESTRLTPVLNTIEQAKLWAAQNANAPAALHVDTGMNRIGAPVSALQDIKAIKGLNITLVMSHLACASNPKHPMNEMQRSRFLEAASHFPGAKLSLSASAGALISQDYVFDMIRPGIALYGGSPFEKDDPRIVNAASLRAPIVQIRQLSPGETVGYGATFTAQRPTQIATVALGYGDGYPRNATAAGAAIVHGQRAPIVGRVSMDFITLDATDLKKPAKPHDIVEFFGADLRLFEAAQDAGRTPYDLLTGLGDRVDRRYL